MAIKNFEYHRKDDIAVFEAGSYDNYERSVDVANFIVDLSEDGGFLGLEVIGASETLPLTKEQLSEVEEVEITVQEDENMMVSIIMKQEGEQTSLNLPVTDLNSQPA